MSNKRRRFCLGGSIVNMPDQLGIDSFEGIEWLRDNMIPYYPLGNFRILGRENNMEQK